MANYGALLLAPIELGRLLQPPSPTDRECSKPNDPSPRH